MKKEIIIPQELQQQIIYEYTINLKGIRKIKKDLQLIYSPQKIKNVLIQNNIHIRGVNEANDLRRKYKINDNYNFNTHNGAWILGLLASDGYLPATYGAQHKVVLTLQRQDEETLQLIKDELKYTGPIYQFESSNGYPCSSLSFTSRYLRKKIESYNITNAKTFIFKHLPKNLSKELLLDFIRGYFDGDGSVFEIAGEKKINMTITSVNKELLEEIGQFLNQYYQIDIPKIYSYQRKHLIYEIRFYKKSSLKLGKLFYCNNYLSLIRKKKHFLELEQKFS